MNQPGNFTPGNNPPRAPPTVAQPSYPSGSDQVGFNKAYLFSLAGLLRLGLIIFQFAGWVAAAAAPKFFNGQSYMPPDISSTRDAYLFFSIIGFVIAIALFCIYSFNLINSKPFNKYPMNLIILATDIIWFIPTFILAIVCAVREGQLKDPLFLNNLFVNIGAFAAASFFGFLCALIYGIDGALFLMKVIRVSR